MNTTLNLNNYPLFTPNQVLTDADLNGVVNYLEGLNQLTRTHFVGMGIVYGLQIQRSNLTEIQITTGCGITSEGFVLQMTTPDRFTHYQESTIALSLFIPNAASQQSYTLQELVPQSIAQKGGTAFHSLTEAGLSNHVVVALYDWQDLPRAESCQLNYDEQSGKERSFRLRFFLLPKQSDQSMPEVTLTAEQLLRFGYPMAQLPDYWQTVENQSGTAAVFEARNQFLAVRDFALQVQRFGYEDMGKTVDLTQIEDYESWRTNYVQICGRAIAAIGKAFPELFRLFSPFFGTFQPHSKQDFATLAQSLNQLLQRFHSGPTNAIATEPLYALQYFYDYLSQLVAAYRELVDVAFDLMDDSTPDMNRFPRFLMLGQVPAVHQSTQGYELPSAYRSTFIQPRIYNNNQTRIQQVKHLYDRLLNLCDFSAGQESFYLLPFYKTPLKITPSKDRSVVLSEQAIPYYLNYPKIYQTWNYDAYRKGRSDRHPAYFYPKHPGDTTPHAFDQLTYRLDAYNFYRIEGHIGESQAKALKEIQDYQSRYNLPFDVITLKLGQVESLQDLNISGQFEHLSATFIQLKERFQLRWTTHQAQWSRNALITTLKKVFFDQPNLATVNPDLLLNPVLDSAKASDNYEFELQNGTYTIFLKNSTGIRIARCQFRSSADRLDRLNFSGMTAAAIALEQKRIISGLVDAFTPEKITYGIDRPSLSLLRFHLLFVSSDRLTVPLDRSGTSSSESLPIELVAIETFAIQEMPVPTLEEPGCPDVATLMGLLRDIPDNFDDRLEFTLGDPDAAREIGSTELTRLTEAYQQRLEQVMSLQIFHRFAQQHPGMEPLGGVPKGGTFVLVYVDGKDVAPLLADEQNPAIFEVHRDRSAAIEAAVWLPPASDPMPASLEALRQVIRDRKDIVVADFCLPYRSSTVAPIVSYVLARPRPVVLLQKTVFCEDDRTAYAFILEPEGGTVKGEGVSFNGQQHVFTPSQISQSNQQVLANGNEVTITFSYSVDDSFDTLSVTVYPKPRPDLTIESDPVFCNNDDTEISIGLAPGTPAHYELVKVTIAGAETTILNPSQYAKTSQSETIAIVALVRDQRTQCENTLEYEVTIDAHPNADFKIGKVDTTVFSTRDPAILLHPSQQGGDFRAQIRGKDISGQVLLKGRTFAPSEVPFDEEETETTVELTYSITQGQCRNDSTRRVKVVKHVEEEEIEIEGEIPTEDTPIEDAVDDRDKPSPSNDEPVPAPDDESSSQPSVS